MSDKKRPRSGGNGCCIPKEAWEIKYNPTAPSKNMKDTEGADFAPKQSKDRKTTYVKVNETDH